MFLAMAWHYCRLWLARLSEAFFWLLWWLTFSKGARLLAAGVGLGIGLNMLGGSAERAAVGHGTALARGMERAAAAHGTPLARGMKRAAVAHGASLERAATAHSTALERAATAHGVALGRGMFGFGAALACGIASHGSTSFERSLVYMVIGGIGMYSFWAGGGRQGR